MYFHTKLHVALNKKNLCQKPNNGERNHLTHPFYNIYI